MRLLHSSIAELSLVQLQHKPKYKDNTATDPRRPSNMAYTTHTTLTSRSWIERAMETASAWLAKAAEKHAQRRVMRSTLRELSALSNRDLADIGTSRAGLISLAYEASQTR